MPSIYEVGAAFKVSDEASLVLQRIARKFEELNALIAETKKGLSSISSVRFAGLATRIGEINKAIGRTGEVSSATSKELDGVAAKVSASFAKIDASVAPALASVKALRAELAAIARGGGGATEALRRRGTHGGGGGGGGHWGSVGVPVPGGAHYRMPGGPALATAGVLAYGIYEESQMQDSVFQLMYHSGLKNTKDNKNKFRNIIQGSMSESGFSLHDVAEAAKTEIRMFKGVGGDGGIGVLPELLRASEIEARLKGTSLEESMKSLIGLAHMTKEYDPDQIKKLAPAFAFLSASNPSSLSSMERAAGYAVPILHAGLDIDPMSTLLLGTVLTRAGITNTKSGTWVRNMFQNALPGTSLMSKTAFKKHEEALKSLGLVDGNDNPTWFTDGRPDAFKLLDIASHKAAGMDLVHRAAAEKALFGVQGEGAFSILSDPAIRRQVDALKKEMTGSDFQNRYATFSDEYAKNSPLQEARKTWADLQNVLMDIGSTVLPPVVIGLRTLDEVLKAIKQHTGETVGNTIIGGGILTGISAWLTKGLWGRGGAARAAGGAADAAAGGGLLGWLGGALLSPWAALGLAGTVGGDTRSPDPTAADIARAKKAEQDYTAKHGSFWQQMRALSPIAYHPGDLSGTNSLADLMDTATQQGVLDGLIKVSDSARIVISSWFSGAGGGGSGGGAYRASYGGSARGRAGMFGRSGIGALGTPGSATAASVITRLMGDYGLSREQATGAAGWMGYESGGFRVMQEIGQRMGHGGWGYAQWTGPRRAAFMAYAAAHHLDPSSDAANYGFMQHELATNYRNVIPALRNARTVEEANRIWGHLYEGMWPGGPGVPAFGAHAEMARRYMHIPLAAPSRPHQASHVHHIYLDGRKIAKAVSHRVVSGSVHPRQAPFHDPGHLYSSIDYGFATG